MLNGDRKSGTNTEEKADDPAHMRIMMRITEGLDTAACVAVIVGVGRETFVEAARRSYDFIERWHNFARKDGETNG